MCLGQLNEASGFKGLISDSGVIRKLPSFVIKEENACVEISNEFLEKLIIRHSTYYGLKHYHINELRNYVLYGKSLTKKAYPPDAHSIPNFRTQLRYCPKCFIEQIEQHGVSWFKLDWQCSIECNIHNQKLFHVYDVFTPCCDRTTNIYRSYISATSGRCFYCSSNVWEDNNEVIIGNWNKSQYMILNNDNHSL